MKNKLLKLWRNLPPVKAYDRWQTARDVAYIKAIAQMSRQVAWDSKIKDET